VILDQLLDMPPEIPKGPSPGEEAVLFGTYSSLLGAELDARVLTMFKKIAITISATSFVMLAIALAPHVPTALATAGHDIDDAKSNQPLESQSCISFEVWFLDPNCSQLQHSKRVTRIKGHLTRKASQ
jgi:hypothetical protein